MEARHYHRVFRKQWWISPVILVDGRAVGTWSHKVSGGKLAIEVQPFGKLSREARAGIAAQSAEIARFLGVLVESKKRARSSVG